LAKGISHKGCSNAKPWSCQGSLASNHYHNLSTVRGPPQCWHLGRRKLFCFLKSGKRERYIFGLILVCYVKASWFQSRPDGWFPWVLNNIPSWIYKIPTKSWRIGAHLWRLVQLLYSDCLVKCQLRVLRPVGCHLKKAPAQGGRWGKPCILVSHQSKGLIWVLKDRVHLLITLRKMSEPFRKCKMTSSVRGED
jgi:hypothetical protein